MKSFYVNHVFIIIFECVLPGVTNFTLGVITRACVCESVFMNESGFAFCVCMSDCTCVITCVNYTFVGLHLSLHRC